MKRRYIIFIATMLLPSIFSTITYATNPVKICATINDTYGLNESANKGGYLSVNIGLPHNQYSIGSDNCVTISHNNTIPYIVDIRYHFKDKSNGKVLIDSRGERFFQDLYTKKEITLTYDLFVVQGGQDNFIKGAVHHQYEIGLDGIGNTTFYTDGYDISTLTYTVQQLYGLGATKYNNNNQFMPNRSLTREQASKFLSVIAQRISGGKLPTQQQIKDNGCVFKDVKSMDSSLISHIENVCVQDIMKGSNGYFNPKGVLTLGEAVATLYRLREGRLDETMTPRYLLYMIQGYNYDLFKLVGYNPNPYVEGENHVSRGMFASMLASIINAPIYREQFSDVVNIPGI